MYFDRHQNSDSDFALAVERFGEDLGIDKLIRKCKYGPTSSCNVLFIDTHAFIDGYRTSAVIAQAVDENEELQDNLSAAAHLMHGSPEDRFTVTYCPGHMSREEIEGVGFDFGEIHEMSRKYDISKLQDGFNDVDGERVFFVSNPALGEIARASL